MKLSGFGHILKIMYTDKMSISRCVETENADGTTDVSTNEKPVYIDIPCRISFSATDNPESNKEDTNPKYLQIKVFCNPEVDVIKGDKLVVSKLDDNGNVITTYTGTANLPQQFITHKEVLLVEVGDA